jgi:hypothetical protein
MGIVRALPELEAWLDADASSWSTLSDREYKALVRRWSECFSQLIAADTSCLQGHRAIQALEARLPADVVLLSGIQVPQLANMGGRGAAAYTATGLCSLRRDLANRMELVLASDDLAWSCVFSHEAGAFVWEHLYERGPDA